MNRLLQAFLTRTFHQGDLTAIDSGGVEHHFGDGSGQSVKVRFADAKTEQAIILDPELELGEAFMDGRFEVLEGSVYDFLEVVLQNMIRQEATPGPWAAFLGRLRFGLRRLRQRNSRDRARRNVAHHYDLNGALYQLFLDPDLQYSCAYFPTPETGLAEAQLAKKRHLAAKLLVDPGMRVLDIGSGWGGLGLYLAELCGADVTGVTLSTEQHGVSNERARSRGLDGQAQFHLKDYRDLVDRFDRIVSVGMFEHVGVGHFDEFFKTCRRLLDDDGVAVLHFIGRSDPPGSTNPWIDKYIFPGGYIPSLSEVTPAVERAGLVVTDIEVLRLHYAETLRAWRRNFLARRDEARALYDERFCRMWEFYLAASETAFRYQGMIVFQIQFARRQEAVPLTRDYVGERERILAEREAGRMAYRMAGE